MDEIASGLEARWRELHREEAEAAFREADDGYVRAANPSFFQKSEVPDTVLAAKREN